MEELFLLLAFNLLLVLCAFVILRVRDFFPLIILLNVCSVILVIIYVLLGAVDVAFTEAVVGASISTIFFMMLVTRIRTSGLRPEVSRRRIPSALVALAVGLVLLKGVNALPSFGDPDSVMQQHVSAQYVENSMHDMHTPNVVTAILADYRGFDTLIETTVIFAAALACLLILGGFWRMGVREEPRHHVFDSVILCTIVRPLAMGTQLYAVYVLLHGHYSPGGGFQGGVLLAASFILPTLLDNPTLRYPRLSKGGAIFLAAIGVLIYASFTAFPLLNGHALLDYAALPLTWLDIPHRRSLGILGIETGVMLAVTGAIVSIYYSLKAEKETELS